MLMKKHWKMDIKTHSNEIEKSGVLSSLLSFKKILQEWHK